MGFFLFSVFSPLRKFDLVHTQSNKHCTQEAFLHSGCHFCKQRERSTHVSLRLYYCLYLCHTNDMFSQMPCTETNKKIHSVRIICSHIVLINFYFPKHTHMLAKLFSLCCVISFCTLGLLCVLQSSTQLILHSIEKPADLWTVFFFCRDHRNFY